MTRPISKDTTNELLVNVVGLRQQLDRTKKQLEIAVDALKDFSIHPDNSVKKYAKKALDKITAEQKD